MNFIQPNWPAPSHIRAFTTVRKTWGDTGEVKSAASEQTLNTLFHLPANPIWLTQTHSTTVVEAASHKKHANADASFTSNPNQVCIVLTADCLPLLICDKQGTQVAAIHAGWRGLANGIIEATLQQLSARPEDLLVWLGPAIGPTKFEVGADVYENFTQKHVDSAKAFNKTSADKWHANLYTLAKLRLQLQDVTQIFGGDYCTYTQADLFPSYRRDKEKAGRIASLIWMGDL